MQVTFIQSIHQVEPDLWNALWASDNPFVQHAFFAALEDSGSTTASSGWQPHHALVKDQGKLIAAVPLFIKNHSYGEYVFDWAWADAYAQHQLDYYPKLVNAVPFTPSTGPRIAMAKGLLQAQQRSVLQLLHKAFGELLEKHGGSGWHSLFPQARDSEALAQLPLVARYGYQFHWFNHDYRSFDDFLATFSSRKRKNVRKERDKVAEAGFELKTRAASEVAEQEWRSFYRLYQNTYLKRSGHYGYLGPGFFPQLAEAMPEQVVLVSAHKQEPEEPMVAAAFYLRDSETLYGRYWGAEEEYDGLHFEACYYRGIDYAIAHGLKRFDPGAQGEHKIQRGFTPVKTCSYHWLTDQRFHEAIANFCDAEARHVDEYIADARRYLPFRDDVALAPVDVLLDRAGTGWP